MAYARTQRRENELPYIPFGPFQIRLPFIHYKIESVEFIQGLILGVTALAAVPYLEQYLGLPYELAWSCVIIETFLYLLHSLLGDPVVPGWITPTLPLTIVFLEGFPMGKERIQAMIALQMLVGLVFIFMGVTRLADKFVHAVPNSVKGGILLAAIQFTHFLIIRIMWKFLLLMLKNNAGNLSFHFYNICFPNSILLPEIINRQFFSCYHVIEHQNS